MVCKSPDQRDLTDRDFFQTNLNFFCRSSGFLPATGQFLSFAPVDSLVPISNLETKSQ